jgi:acyl transferase domain-containing protein
MLGWASRYVVGLCHYFNANTPKDEYELRGSFARIPTMLANRISFHLDLLGPSFPLDTACSSTQTAFHLAVQSILSGDCESALVGGCQLNQR